MMPDWPGTEDEAVAEQLRLRGRVRRTGSAARVRFVAGVDVAYRDRDSLAAAVSVLDVATLSIVEERTARGTARFPYVPGLFAFRELPTLLEAVERLQQVPDVLMCDGYGLAHPRRFGLAIHLGVVVGRPSVGVAKTAFVGSHGEVGVGRGAWAELVDGGEVVGRVLRTRGGVKPVYVSVGHAVGLDEACALVLRVSPRYRLPEPIRAADQLARKVLAASP